MKPITAAFAPLLAGVTALAPSTAAAADHAAVRSVAETMRQPPLIEIRDAARGWLLEKSDDFGVVLLEVSGTIPLHMHPDGNRRMFVVEGRIRMRGGDHEAEMGPGDYMYLPRDHQHKVWLAAESARALLMLVDNPPTSTRNVVWLEAAPRIDWHPAQAASAFEVAERCETAPGTAAKAR